jgi:hypothetical protein
VVDSRDGNLPLHLAASLGRLDLVECLVRAPDDPDHGDDPSRRANPGNRFSSNSSWPSSGGGGKSVGGHGVGSGASARLSSAEEKHNNHNKEKKGEEEEKEGRTQQPRLMRPRSHLQRQNRWGCTPHDLAFIMEGHRGRGVVAFLGGRSGCCCSREMVETQHVLDRNARLERDAALRKMLEVRALLLLQYVALLTCLFVQCVRALRARVCEGVLCVSRRRRRVLCLPCVCACLRLLRVFALVSGASGVRACVHE